MNTREIIEGEQEQGVDEEIVYILTTTPWGTSPGTVSVKVFSINETVSPPIYTDVTSTVMPAGSASASGDVITFPKIKALTENALYRVEPKFTCSGNVFEPYAYIRCRR